MAQTGAGPKCECLDSSKGRSSRYLQEERRDPDKDVRLFKFPQMDFEMAVWEMTHLLIAPKKVFKSIYYHKREGD